MTTQFLRGFLIKWILPRSPENTHTHTHTLLKEYQKKGMNGTTSKSLGFILAWELWCNPGWSQTYNNPPSSASQGLEFYAWGITPNTLLTIFIYTWEAIKKEK